MAVVVALTNLIGGPGFAHALAGRWRTGALWLAAGLVAAVGATLTPWAAYGGLLVGLASIVHAAAHLRRAPQPVRWRRLPAALMFLATLVAVGILNVAVLESFRVPSSNMAPTLELGDHFYINKLASPGPGDIILFRHPCQPEADYVKRVIATGGDTVEVRCKVVRVNGTPLAQQPVAGPCTYDDEYQQMDGSTEAVKVECRRARESLADHAYDVYFAAEPAAGRDFPDGEAPSCRAAMMPDGPELPRGTVVRTAEATDPCAAQAHFVVPSGTLFVLGDNRDNSNDSRYWGVVPTSHVKGTVTGIWWPLDRIGAVD